MIPLPQTERELATLLDDVLSDRLPQSWRGLRIDDSPYFHLADWIQSRPTNDSEVIRVRTILKKVLYEELDRVGQGGPCSSRLVGLLRLVEYGGFSDLAILAESLVPHSGRIGDPDAISALIRTSRLNHSTPSNIISFYLTQLPDEAASAWVGFQLLRIAAESRDPVIFHFTSWRVRGWCKTADEQEGFGKLEKRLLSEYPELSESIAERLPWNRQADLKGIKIISGGETLKSDVINRVLASRVQEVLLPFGIVGCFSKQPNSGELGRDPFDALHYVKSKSGEWKMCINSSFEFFEYPASRTGIYDFSYDEVTPLRGRELAYHGLTSTAADGMEELVPTGRVGGIFERRAKESYLSGIRVKSVRRADSVRLFISH